MPPPNPVCLRATIAQHRAYRVFGTVTQVRNLLLSLTDIVSQLNELDMPSTPASVNTWLHWTSLVWVAAWDEFRSVCSSCKMVDSSRWDKAGETDRDGTTWHESIKERRCDKDCGFWWSRLKILLSIATIDRWGTLLKQYNQSNISSLRSSRCKQLCEYLLSLFILQQSLYSVFIYINKYRVTLKTVCICCINIYNALWQILLHIIIQLTGILDSDWPITSFSVPNCCIITTKHCLCIFMYITCCPCQTTSFNVLVLCFLEHSLLP